MSGKHVSINLISRLGATAEGATLWVVPDKKLSSWSRELDWHCNFVFSKADIRVRHERAPELQEILDQNGIVVNLKENLIPEELLVSTSHCLPNTLTLLAPYPGDLESWIEKILSVAKKLKCLSLRIFLPYGIGVSDLREKWFLESEYKEVGVVVDHSPEGLL